MKHILSLLLLTLLFVAANAQQVIQRGKVVQDLSKSQGNVSLAKIKIRLSDDSQIGITDSAGYFTPSETLFPGDLIFGYRNGEKVFGYKWLNPSMRDSQTTRTPKNINPTIDLQTITLGSGLDLIGEVRIRISQGGPFLEEIKPQKLQLNPSMGNGIESLVKTFIGASSGNEMSSQYTVRGGNYDENLIYVNDIEILRPQLISSGQQEGLSFINSDLVQSVKFSAGGFGAQYGDKMSSVLDVDYIRPDSFKGSATIGTMLSSATVSGKKNRFSGFLGIRNFNNSLLTKTLNVKGNYSMHFNDLQTQVTYKLHRKLFIDFLGNLASNNYTLNPTSRSTTFGTIQNAYQLDVGMGGQESLKYLYGMGSLTLRYTPNIKNEFKWMLNHTSIEEQEVFDVEGLYYLSQLDRDMGSKTYGKPLKTLGYGYYIDHGRNRMMSGVTQFAHIGKIGKTTDAFSWNYSIRLNKESVDDKSLSGITTIAQDITSHPLEEWRIVFFSTIIS